jgi:hypothetical protein
MEVFAYWGMSNSLVGSSWEYFKHDYVTQVEVGADLQTWCGALHTMAPHHTDKLDSITW